MTIKTVNLKTKKKTVRDWTQKELVDMESARARDEKPITLEDKLAPTEEIKTLARKLEEVIDNIENGVPLSADSRAWMQQRKTIRSS